MLDEKEKWITPANGQPYETLFKKATRKYGLPAGLLSRVAFQESNYDPGAYNPNSGARGMMQIVGTTSSGSKIHPDANYPGTLNITDLDPADDIDYAAWYLKTLYNYFHSWALAVAAYNWGIGNVGKNLQRFGMGWLSNVPTETFKYVTNVTRDVGLPLA